MVVSRSRKASSDNVLDWPSFLRARAGLSQSLPLPSGDGQLGNIFLPLLEARQKNARLVVGQLGQSIDGRISTVTGHSHYINNKDALLHLHHLRALVDAVIVGAGTVLADDPQLTVRHCAGPQPARVIIDPNCRISLASKCFVEDGVTRIVIQTDNHTRAAGVDIIRLTGGSSGIPPAAILEALAGIGLKIILVEGGGTTVSRMLQASCLDRLHVAVAPLIIGSGRPGITLPEITSLDEAQRPATTCYPLPSGDVIFDCDLRRNMARS